MKKIGILLIAAGLFCSCQDFLNLVPKNQQVVYTQEDVKSSMSAFLLSSGRGTAYVTTFNGRSLTFPLPKEVCVAYTMYGDDIDMPRYFDYQSGSSMKKLYNECADWKAINVSTKMWGYFYTSIGYLNEALKNLKNAPNDNSDLYEQISGEARVFRAFYAFKLMQFFAPYGDNALGIPLNFDADVVSASGRLKQSEVYRIIIRELTDVLGYSALAQHEWNVMYDKDIIKAMLAQIYLYKAGSAAAEESDWANAEKYSGELADKYSLESDEEGLNSQFVPEAVLGWRKDNPYALLMMVCANGNNSGYAFSPWGAETDRLFPNPDLVEMYDERDVRLKTYLGNQEMVGVNQWYIGKFNYYPNRNKLNESIALFRIAEMYLINAEANARMNKIDPAKRRLEKFMQSRVPGYTAVSGNVLEEVLKERRKEFCYEGEFRFMDIKRLGLAVSRRAIDPKDGDTKVFDLVVNDYRYTLPIPVDLELAHNNIEQNPGWNIFN